MRSYNLLNFYLRISLRRLIINFLYELKLCQWNYVKCTAKSKLVNKIFQEILARFPKCSLRIECAIFNFKLQISNENGLLFYVKKYICMKFDIKNRYPYFGFRDYDFYHIFKFHKLFNILGYIFGSHPWMKFDTEIF